MRVWWVRTCQYGDCAGVRSNAPLHSGKTLKYMGRSGHRDELPKSDPEECFGGLCTRASLHPPAPLAGRAAVGAEGPGAEPRGPSCHAGEQVKLCSCLPSRALCLKQGSSVSPSPGNRRFFAPCSPEFPLAVGFLGVDWGAHILRRPRFVAEKGDPPIPVCRQEEQELQAAPQKGPCPLATSLACESGSLVCTGGASRGGCGGLSERCGGSWA